ncbi:MAG: MazG nucleotide pyrophosphohydrolase domain-containing protein [Sodalis sp. (in: enterobacteria)]|uniref:MazG nucleotide pyrophosphohydrolase domain-containing protein n=1 Tax=Sodalis sp. (in: enterobacteria) TaxID=1898979 RepID=UPI0039E6F8B3
MSEPHAGAALHRLLTIMTRLRDPQAGCPWDKSQTFDSIAPCTLEETYEVLDAIARRDFGDLRAELGDLLFATVNLSRHLGQTAEVALQQANRKFERRFRQVEAIIDAQGLTLTQASLE